MRTIIKSLTTLTLSVIFLGHLPAHAQNSQGKKSGLSQLEFDNTIQQKNKATPQPKNMTPLELLLQQAEKGKGEKKSAPSADNSETTEKSSGKKKD